MNKSNLDFLLSHKDLTKEQYEEFLKCMTVDGDISNLLNFVINEIDPPRWIEYVDETFETYGYMYYGDYTRWVWFRSDTISDEIRKYGNKPIEEASELELWKMIAISSRHSYFKLEKSLEEFAKIFAIWTSTDN